MNTTILLNKSIVNSLKDIKEYPRQTYNELLEKLITVFKAQKSKGYSAYVNKIQQSKMKELWDNKEDEVWDNV